MKAKTKTSFLVLMLSVLPTACAFYHENNPGDPSTVVPGTVSWNQVSARVFQPRCAICHAMGGAGFNSSTYQSVADQLSNVQQRTISTHNMPPDSPLTPFETTLLQDWINEGAPYNAP